MTLISLAALASFAFGTPAAPRGSFLCRAACGFQAAVHVYFVGLKNATRPTNCRTGEASLDYRCRNSSASFQDASPLPEIIAEQPALSLKSAKKNISLSCVRQQPPGEAKRCFCSARFFPTFPSGKVPAGRMRDLHDPHQSRCARQLPPGEAKSVEAKSASSGGNYDTITKITPYSRRILTHDGSNVLQTHLQHHVQSP